MIGASAWMVIQDDPFRVEGTSVVPPSARAAMMSNADIVNKALATIKPGGFSELTHEDFLSVVKTATYVNAPAPVIAPVYDAATDTASISAVDWANVTAYIKALESALDSAVEKIPSPPPREPTHRERVALSLQHAMSACTLLDAYGR